MEAWARWLHHYKHRPWSLGEGALEMGKRQKTKDEGGKYETYLMAKPVATS
jgi:hypothetical protein